MTDATPASMLPALGAMADADLRPGLERIAVPVLLVHGERDVRSTRPVVDDLAGRLPTARLVVIPDAGHDVNVEAPGAFNDAVRAFASEVDRSRSAG
jgi:pimeloyl-ACP methyl ester carboxylesterase